MRPFKKIEEDLFNRGLEVTLTYHNEDEVEIKPYALMVPRDSLDDPAVLDWIEHICKTHFRAKREILTFENEDERDLYRMLEDV